MLSRISRFTAVMALLIMSVFFSGAAYAQDGFFWNPPTEREDGTPLTVDELGGYELRYTVGGTTLAIVIPDGSATHYEFKGLPAGDISFEIAAFDKNGLYSNFVPITYKKVGRPGSPSGVEVKPVVKDVIAACLSDPDHCRVLVRGEW